MNLEHPKHGDTVLLCMHACNGSQSLKEAIDEMGPVHFWKLDGYAFRRPNGSRGTAQWVIGCDACAKAAKMQPLKIPIVGDAVWLGDEEIEGFIPAPSIFKA